ncbi:DUF2514 family protein [Pseudomonas sp. 10B1]|uniref:DUF2514 family protein n=1 Tax=unclassified Pseudomonas TaxID=196821 RepID=UPI002B2219A6|nr:MULTISPECIES: DUF2514 family protein [unclassified Pseudomonas]MEA9994520.1 DUF2514 family protein [Pseudomonas sp. AA4]MEB0085664.1 DUF2514 family protein [Pseudomonas sp. RTI1]MEB0126010.1 DUF2514 family protein [Pseudomonas sp. CCC1.2]MEB0152815.1 DUF2514 family protein [Pseudomonas sp. CCC4.3]MEB0221320.1 DUF2514 family protein [Pseudomonas sp. AB12(2023)]
MTSIYAKSGAFLLAVLLIFGALYGAYHHGKTVDNNDWQSRWNDRDTKDAAAALTNEATQRDLEQARQHSINKVIESGQQLLNTAQAALDASHASDSSLRATADNLAAQLAASTASGNSCTTNASKAATRAAVVLADVFKRADQRAGDLASYADQSYARGVTCEQAFDGLTKLSADPSH